MSVDDIIDRRQMGRCLTVLLPILLLWAVSGDVLWLRAAVATVAVFIGIERVHLAPWGVVLHMLALMAGFMLLQWSLTLPLVFVICSGVMAAGAIGLSAYGSKLRSLGNYVFLPSLYLACETAEDGVAAQYVALGLHLLPYLAVCMLPVWLMALVEHYRRRDATSLWRHLARLRFSDDADSKMTVREAMLAGGLAVAIAAAAVEWFHISHGQWVIWSAASVVTGDVLTAKRKLRDRAFGVLVGVPLGIAAGSLLPHTPAGYALIALLTVLTLVSFRKYTVGFAARCACASGALMMLNAPASEAAAARLFTVLLGGVIGICLVLAVNALLRRNEAASTSLS